MRVFASAGTDLHPFDRLVAWMDDWASAHPGDEVVVQHGTTRPPRVAEGHELLAVDEMRRELEAADVVIVSAGPGAVMAARAAGRKPIAMPRRGAEHVDEHQRAFARHMGDRGTAFCVESHGELLALLERAGDEPEAFRCEPMADTPPEAAGVLGGLVDRLVHGP